MDELKDGMKCGGLFRLRSCEVDLLATQRQRTLAIIGEVSDVHWKPICSRKKLKNFKLILNLLVDLHHIADK